MVWREIEKTQTGRALYLHRLALYQANEHLTEQFAFEASHF